MCRTFLISCLFYRSFSLQTAQTDIAQTFLLFLKLRDSLKFKPKSPFECNQTVNNCPLNVYIHTANTTLKTQKKGNFLKINSVKSGIEDNEDLANQPFCWWDYLRREEKFTQKRKERLHKA